MKTGDIYDILFYLSCCLFACLLRSPLISPFSSYFFFLLLLLRIFPSLFLLIFARFFFSLVVPRILCCSWPHQSRPEGGEVIMWVRRAETAQVLYDESWWRGWGPLFGSIVQMHFIILGVSSGIRYGCTVHSIDHDSLDQEIWSSAVFSSNWSMRERGASYYWEGCSAERGVVLHFLIDRWWQRFMEEVLTPTVKQTLALEANFVAVFVLYWTREIKRSASLVWWWPRLCRLQTWSFRRRIVIKKRAVGLSSHLFVENC